MLSMVLNIYLGSCINESVPSVLVYNTDYPRVSYLWGRGGRQTLGDSQRVLILPAHVHRKRLRTFVVRTSG